MRRMWSIILPVLVLLIILCTILMPYPWHASCHIDWSVSASCATITEKLVAQIQAWEGDSLCPNTSAACPTLPCGQRCLYSLLDNTGGVITASHQTPVKRFTDTMRIELTSNSQAGCSIEATSQADTWYAILDFGTNYCNLRNLVDGAGISTMPGFRETTQDSVCTQYSTRDCTRF